MTKAKPEKIGKKRHEEYAERIIAMLEKGMAPWQKPWAAGSMHPPFNPVRGTVYSGINRVMLSEYDYADPRWMSFKQANQKGYRVKKGEKSQPIVHWQWTETVDKLDEDGQPILDDNGQPEKEVWLLGRPRIRFFSVFHASQLQMENGQPIPPFEPKKLDWQPHERAEAILEASGAKIIHDQRDRAFYAIQNDEIHLPPKENFGDEGKYYPIALHELSHWTRHPSRLNRENGPFGSESYAREELRAHIASWMLSQDLGIAFNPDHQTSYLQSWVKVLKDDPYEIFRACSDAERIKKYILGLEQKQEQTAEIVFTDSEPDQDNSPSVDVAAVSVTPDLNEGMDNPAERLNDDIEGAAAVCAAAVSAKGKTAALDIVISQTTRAMESDYYNTPGTEIESTILARINHEARRLNDSTISQDALDTQIHKIVTLGNIQGRRSNSGYLEQYRKVLQRYVDDYGLGPDEMKVVSGDFVSFKQDFDGGRFDWCLDPASYEILCREDSDHPWREPTAEEEKILEGAGDLMLAPIIPLNDGRFLTYDGRVHGRDIEAEVQPKNSADRLSSIIEQITRLNALADGEESTRGALTATKEMLVDAVASPDYSQPGTEIQSAIIKSMHYRCGRHDLSTEPLWLLNALNYSIISLGNIEANLLESEHREENLAKLAVYNQDMGPREMGLASGQNTDFKRDLDGQVKDWAWERESGTILCRENADSPWRFLDQVEKSQLRAYDHEAELVPVLRLADGRVMTYDGQLHGNSLVREAPREVDTEIIRRYLESSASEIASSLEDGKISQLFHENLLREIVKNGRNIMSRPAYIAVAHTQDAAMLKHIVHNLAPIMAPDADIAPDDLPFMLNDVLMTGQINAKLLSDHVQAGRYQAAIEANIRERFANDPKKAESLIPRMTGREVRFDHNLPSGRLWCRRLNDGAAMYKNHEHDFWEKDAGEKLNEDFPENGFPPLTPILEIDRTNFLDLNGGQYRIDPDKKAAFDQSERESKISRQTNYVNDVLESLVRPNMLMARENMFKAVLETAKDVREADFARGEVKFNAFLDEIGKIGQLELDSSAADSELTPAQIEMRVANAVLAVVAASRELDYRGLDYAANESPGPKYRLAPLVNVGMYESPADLKHRGQQLLNFREAIPGETPLAFAVVTQHGNELITGFTDQRTAEGFTTALNSREIELIDTPVSRFSDEKVFLEVPFKEKDQPKGLGATWDKDKKKWCARPGTDLTPLEKWIVQEKEQLQSAAQAENKPFMSRNGENPSPDVEPVTEVVYLQVPYKAKNEAKQAGAKWDKDKKLWYAPVGADLGRLAKFVPEKEPAPVQSLSPVEEFRQVLESNGFVLKGDPVMDGKIHRAPIVGKPNQRDGAYQAYADGVPNGWFENHRDGTVTKWVYSGQKLSPEQKKLMQAEFDQRRERAEKEREDGYAKAADRVFEKFAETVPIPVDPEHPYLKSKGVDSYGLHQDQDGNLLVFGLNLDKSEFPGLASSEAGPRPALGDFTVTRHLQTMQTISPDGEKRFERGSRKQGAVHLIGENQFKKIAYDQTYRQQTLFDDLEKKPEILLAEGYATGASLHKATGLPVAVAFDAGNLLPVAEALRRKFPKADLTICADHDHTRDFNVGLGKAYETARAVGAEVVFPQFTEDEKAKGLTDFNDLAQSRGIFEVTKQVSPRFREQAASVAAPAQADRPGASLGMAM